MSPSETGEGDAPSNQISCSIPMQARMLRVSAGFLVAFPVDAVALRSRLMRDPMILSSLRDLAAGVGLGSGARVG